MAPSPKPPRETGCSLAVVAVFLVMGGLIRVFPYILTALFYAFPFFLLFLFAKSWGSRRPELQHIDDEQADVAFRSLQIERNKLHRSLVEIKQRGLRDGIRFLAYADRFEMRSRQGQNLNEDLAYTGNRLADIDETIFAAGTPMARKLLALQGAMWLWRRRRAFSLAFRAAAVVFVAVTIANNFYPLFEERTVFALLVWNPTPRFGVGFAASTFAGWSAGLATLLIARRYYQRFDTAEFDNQPRHGADEPSRSNAEDAFEIEDGEPSGQKDPYEVLNISREASVPDIKAAYRNAIRRCHPDTVADRSDYIRGAAEIEARLINNAYESIRAERSFS